MVENSYKKCESNDKKFIWKFLENIHESLKFLWFIDKYEKWIRLIPTYLFTRGANFAHFKYF